MESARRIFYNVYRNHGESNTINGLVRQLDFHALSITLLATTASHNIWDYDRLTEEWNTQRAQVLRTDHDRSLAATIELSLASPTFRNLGPGARKLLGAIAFFPQGIDKNNLGWLFPDIPDIRSTFDKFCALSLRTATITSPPCWHQFEITLLPRIQTRLRSYARPGIATSSGCR